jgi:superfamily I DNA/RNA helicase
MAAAVFWVSKVELQAGNNRTDRHEQLTQQHSAGGLHWQCVFIRFLTDGDSS